MLKNKLDALFARVKDFLPTEEARTAVRKLLQECDILTQSEMQKQVAQIEMLRERVQQLEARLDALEQRKK